MNRIIAGGETVGGASDSSPPYVAVFAGFDGSGGAGLLADCRAIAAAGCVPLAVATALTAQNLDGARQVWNVPPARARAQFACYSGAAARIGAVKVGVVGRAAAVAAKCARECDAPLVWDPVLAPSGGNIRFAGARADLAAMRRHLLPAAAVLTPNRRELLQLAEEKRVDAAIRRLFALGCRRLLVTDINGRGPQVRNMLLDSANGAPLWETTAPRIAGDYHGTGCLFSSTLAARLARNTPLPEAAQTAHDIVMKAIRNAKTLPELGRQKML